MPCQALAPLRVARHLRKGCSICRNKASSDVCFCFVQIPQQKDAFNFDEEMPSVEEWSASEEGQAFVGKKLHELKEAFGTACPEARCEVDHPKGQFGTVYLNLVGSVASRLPRRLVIGLPGTGAHRTGANGRERRRRQPTPTHWRRATELVYLLVRR
jgi:hypothetical protein